MDSDSEIYDTEALSIMDINDIIGVQSEPVSDSTLESEIAALSQMITESKTDGTQNAEEIKDEEATTVRNSDTVQMTDTAEDLMPALDELEKVCCVEETTSNKVKQSGKENSLCSNVNILQESLQLCEQQKDVDIRDNCESTVLSDCVSAVGAKDVEYYNVSSEMDVDIAQVTDETVFGTSGAVNCKENVNSSDASEQGNGNIETTTTNSQVAIKSNENSIRGSLQLIGEAYSSEDSQESTVNNEGPSLEISSNENSLIPSEERNDTNILDEPQQNVNNVSEKTDDIGSDKSCTDKDIVNETIDREKVSTTEVDSSNCSLIPECIEELSITSEDTKDVVTNQSETNSPSNRISEHKEQSIDLAATEISNVQEKEIGIDAVEEASTMEQFEIEVNEKSDNPTVNTYIAQDEKHEVEVTEESTERARDQETVESMDIEEEKSHEGERDTNEDKDANQGSEEIRNTNVSKDEEINTGTDTAVYQMENELQVEPMQSEMESKTIDNPATNASDKNSSLQVTDIEEVSKEKADELGLPQVSEEMDTEKLEAVETELEEKPVEPLSNQLPFETNGQTSVTSEKGSTPILQASVVPNILNKVEDTETNMKVESEKKDNLDTVSSELKNIELKENVIIEPVEKTEFCSTEEISGQELKPSISTSSDSTPKCEASMEVNLDVESVTSVVKTDVAADSVNPMVISTPEDSLKDNIEEPMEENSDKVIEKMDVTHMDIKEVENNVSEEQNRESNETENAAIEETEPTVISESRGNEILVQQEEIRVEEQTEEKITSEEQAEGKDTTEEQIKNNVTGENQVEDKVLVEDQIKENITIEKESEVEVTDVKEAEEEEVFQDEKSAELVTVPKELGEDNVVEEQMQEEEKECLSKVTVEVEQSSEIKNEVNESQNDENTCCPAVEEGSLEHFEENVLHKEVNAGIEESTYHAKDIFVPMEKIVIPKEDSKEEHMEEEMNLTLEPEETESQPDTAKSDVEDKTDNEQDVGFSEEIVKQDQEDSTVKMDDSLNVEKSSLIQVKIGESVQSDDIEEPALNKNEELLDKQQGEDSDSNVDTNKDNLKDILVAASNVEEMFSGEQCQNTQDIVTNILDDVRSENDFKNILGTQINVANEIEKVLQQSENIPLVESVMEELTEKLPQDSEDTLSKDMEDTVSNQNTDSLEGLLGIELMPERDDSALKATKTEEQLQKSDQLSKVVNMSTLLEQSNHTSDTPQASDYIKNEVSSCLTYRNTVPLEDTNTEKSDTIQSKDDKMKDTETDSMLKLHEAIITKSVDKEESEEDLQKDLREDTDMPENELVMDFEETPLESVGDLEETESKLELASDILLQTVDQGENLNDAPSGIETSQPSSEISELESAVKFLQESEEQAMDSPLVLSPKMVESVVDDISKQDAASSLFVADEDMCENTSELEAELQNIATNSISISEAEIISEAAKLESEKKLAEQIKMDASKNKFKVGDGKEEINEGVIEEKIAAATESSLRKLDETNLQKIEMQQTANLETIATLPQKVLKTSESIPKVSILEERLKEPPKIEIPSTDVTKVSMSPTNSKDSLLIQKDAKLIAYQKMLESPKLSDKSEPRIVETPRKDSEKHDFENVGSPRIILKIAKSAITDCGEPRSPKSPKIRSATNSPNPEDSPGQKLGKIKLKLSKGGHPSIISNENVEEVGQWYSEGSSSLSPIGMKIKLSKLGDASIVSSEKYDTVDDSKEGKHKYEETKRTESPIGMKIKLSKTGDASIVQQDCKELQMKHKEKLDMIQGSPKRTESPIGMKIKLSKTGDASIIQPERQDHPEEFKESTQMKSKERHETCYDSPKRTDSPIGMKIKLSKTGDASIVSPDLPEENKESGKVKDKFESSPEVPKRTDSPIGMKIKLAKTKSGASIISVENSEETKDKLEIPDTPKRTESPLGMKIKLSKTGDASIVHSEVADEIKEKVEAAQDAAKSSDPSCGTKTKVIRSGEMQTVTQESLEESTENLQEAVPKVESPLGMKIKFSKFGDASIVPSERQEQPEEGRPLPETPKRTESPLGMKIKLSKSGDASIIQPETSEDANKITRTSETEHSKTTDSTLGMKIKLLKTGDASIVDSEKKDRQHRRRDTESPLEMKIKLSKSGHATIVACDNQAESGYKPKEAADPSQNFAQRYKEPGQVSHKEPALKILKAGHSTILQSNRSELTIEPVQMQGKKPDNVVEISPKRKDITISPVESKKSKLESQFTQILPEVTIQPVASRDQKQFLFDPKSNSISLQQMNVINQEISITQVRPQKPGDPSMSGKLKNILSKNVSGSPMNSDCEIIEHRPELIIVNENSNSSQDVMIIEEVSPHRMPEVKVPKKRGRPRRNPLPQGITHLPPHMLMPRDPLSLDDAQLMQQPQVPHFAESRENERPKRTCRSQKSYAPPKRGRGRGRGKRKMDAVDPQIAKKPRIEQDLNMIEASTTAIITLQQDPTMQQESFGKSPELYKALKQPAMDSKVTNSTGKVGKRIMGQKNDAAKSANVVNNTIPDFADTQLEMSKTPEMRLPKPISNDPKDSIKDKKLVEAVPERAHKTAVKDEKGMEIVKSENRDMLVPPGHPNWLTPTSKRAAEGATKQENVSTVQVIDEETRMSAESGSRSQTPARNISAPASEAIVNEESQGSVLSTATTESEKVKVKNRRMEINFDPDEGPFTVDKIAEYEWPLDRKGETFMIQEQISQYLGVKSFKRKYPDLKRRVVDMEERNYLRENGLVSEAMCDMGLTAVCSSEVLDVMCSDFPDQYEEYRKHMREKQVKEHSKKQKELTAAANAEKNRIDLAEMAVQSALSWNISLNKARRESRKCSLDLQTFTIHVPKKQQKVETERRIGHYPVALIPGQYTDYYREYTPAELRYYPLNTVLYGPMRPNERKFDSQSEGSQSDSDSDSSSDDSSSSSSEGTQDTEGSQSTMDDVDMEIANQKDEIKLKCKMCLKALNKHSKNEVLIQCGTCNGHVHPSCIDLTLDMVPHIQSYAWQCTDCKTCAQCHDPADEDKMLFCDMCDRGYHIYCVGLRRVPQGRWHCQECAVCANCGSREPGGMNSDRNSVAQWQHEYKKGDKNTRVYVSTLCVPCSKLRGDQGGALRQEKLSV